MSDCRHHPKKCRLNLERSSSFCTLCQIFGPLSDHSCHSSFLILLTLPPSGGTEIKCHCIQLNEPLELEALIGTRRVKAPRMNKPPSTHTGRSDPQSSAIKSNRISK